MKTNIYLKSVLALALTASLTACDENAWNDHLKGFEEKNDEPIPNVQTIEYTLTDADYASIAGNADNKTLAGADKASALSAVATRKAFSELISAREYVPNFLASSSFPYFTLTEGSAVKLTYNVAQNLPSILNDAMAASAYTVDEVDYQEVVWESETDYVESFSPSKPASRYISRILSENVTAENPYCVVTYNVSNQEPVFGGSSKPAEWEMSSTIGSATLNAAISCKGVISAVCAQGYMVTDKSGSILFYVGKSFDSSSVAVGQQVEIDGTVGAYNKGFQINGTTASVTVVGEQAVNYPAAKTMTGAEVDQAITRTDNELAQYVQIKGTAVISGNFVNINIAGAETAQGSIYQATDAQKALFSDGAEVTVEGYFIAISGGRFFNMIPTKVNGAAVKAARHASRAASVKVPSEVEKALYVFSNGAWAPAADFSVLNPADYKAMGQTYSNFNSAADARRYLARYLSVNYPYAAADDVENVLYEVYNSTDKKNVFMADQYTFNGTEWVLNTGIVTETAQFVLNSGKWIYDPNVTITLPAGRNQELSMKYFQACVDWVYNNICVPMGDTSIKSGKFYVSSYGNNEYYSGTSAYQGNVDLRPSAARTQYAAGYEGMSDDEIVALEKQRFMNEVMPGALSTLHPDAVPIEGLDVIYTINFSVYTGSTTAYTARFRVVGPGKFEPIDCTWDN